MLNIVVADDHNVVRHGLRVLLDAEPDIHVVGEAADGLGALRLVQSLKPDVLVVDLMMGGMNGLEVTARVTKRWPKTGVVILSMYDVQAYVVESLRRGAKAYILKESTSDELVHAIHSVAAGNYWLSSSISERVIQDYMERGEAPEKDPYEVLTSREREVLHLMVQGKTSGEIATRLVLSRRTVETHSAHILRKFGFRRKAELIQFALRRELLPMNREMSL